MNRPPFSTFPVLQSSRIRLRELVAVDAPHIIEIISFQRVPATNAEEVVSFLAKIDERYRQGDGINWGVEDISTGEITGSCGFYRGFANDVGEVGYKMKERFRNKGYMSEAVSLAVQFGFEVLELKKIFAVTAQDNLASQSVLRKNGFIAAGIEESGDLKFHRVR